MKTNDNSSSFQQQDNQLLCSSTVTTHADSPIPFEGCSDSCKNVLSEAVIIPLQGHENHPVLNDRNVFINTELSVKHEPLYSETENLETKIKMLGDVNQMESMPVSFDSNLKEEPLLEGARKQDIDHYSHGGESFHVSGNSELATPVHDQPHYYQWQQEQQQQQQQQQQQKQITDLSCKLSLPLEHGLLLLEHSVIKNEKTNDAESEESMVAYDLQRNNADEMDEGTETMLGKNINLCSSPEYILPDEDEETQGQSNQRRRLQKPNSLPAPLELQEAASGEAFTQAGSPNTTEERPYACDVCGKAFKRSQSLVRHHRIHTGERPYACDVCGKDFTQASALVCHERTHTGVRPFKCDVCGKAFGQSGDLQLHRRVHTGERPYACDVCGKTFQRSSHLTGHKRMHTGERRYSCAVCGKDFTRSNSLNNHKRTHTGERPYVCEVCGKAFTESGTLALHKRRHTGERLYECDVCGKAFTHSSGLLRHTRMHTGERPYACDVCGKAFVQSGDLARHTLTHSGQRPFRCDVCGKAFTHSGSLTIHLRVHTGQRPFGCDACSHRCSTKANLIAHLRTHSHP